LAELAAASRPAQATLSRLNEAGNETWLDVEARLLERPAGSIAWYLTDVTGRIELSRALVGERAGLGEVFDDTGIGFCIIDQKGRILSANRTLAGWLGYAVETLEGGMRVSEIAASDIDLTAKPEMLASNASAVPCEAKLCACDGQILDVVVTRTAFRNPETDGWETHAIVRNPSLEREREAALKRAEERFRRFFDFAPVAVATVDEAGLIMEANPVFRGWVAEGVEVVGQPLAALASEDHRDDVRRYIAQAWDDGTLEGSLEVRLDEAQMGNRLMQLYLSRLEDAEGDTNGLLLHFIDITEQRDLEIQFAQSQKMQAVGQLAGGVAHDFNNLLTAIIGHTDLLMLRFNPGDEAFPDIMQVKQNANRAANLVRQLLAFSRRQTLRPKVLSLTDVLAELTHLLRRLIGENIELKVVHGRDVDLVKVDENQFEQVIINLAVNSRDAMSTGGALEISTENIHHDGRRLGDGVLMAAGD
jgi:two-component system cell cycle sensor histidine kinase/response regulator CckA